MNKHRTATLLVVAAASIILMGSAAGQQGQHDPKSSPSANAPVAGVMPLGVTVEEVAVLAQGWRASKLLHAAVSNDQNEHIGSVDDFIVSPDAKISIVVIEVGGFLGVGAHRVAIPFSQLTADTKKVVVKGATKDALRKLPEFNYVD